MMPNNLRNRSCDPTKIASFFGGLAFIAVVVGFTIYRNEQLKEEIADQARVVLKDSRALIQQVQSLVTRLRASSNSQNEN